MCNGIERFLEVQVDRIDDTPVHNCINAFVDLPLTNPNGLEESRLLEIKCVMTTFLKDDSIILHIIDVRLIGL